MRPRQNLLLCATVTLALAGNGTAVCAQNQSVSIPNSRAFAEPPRGTLIIAGGALRFDNVDVWKRLVKLAAARARELGEPEGTRPRIAVFPTAAFWPQLSGERHVAALKQYGADGWVVPIAVKNAVIDYTLAVRDPEVIEQIRNSHAIFFTGGQQSRIIEALYTPEGTMTPALEAVWDVYRRGGVIAGSSAGAAVMSQIMCQSVDSQLGVLERGVVHGKETAPGLGFLDPNWFVDQHFIVRARFARALAVTQHHRVPHGLGIDENTALLVHGNTTEIVGYRGALFLDLSAAESDPGQTGFNVRNARISYLDRGDRLNMQTLELTLAPEKPADSVIDPTSPSFLPVNDEPIFTTEILGNSTLLDVMRRLMNNRNSHAIGLAFDGTAAQKGPVPAYEFRLYRDRDTRAWPPGMGDEYTISNVHLDVRRVEFTGFSYK